MTTSRVFHSIAHLNFVAFMQCLRRVLRAGQEGCDWIWLNEVLFVSPVSRLVMLI